jgi:Putative zinc-finger
MAPRLNDKARQTGRYWLLRRLPSCKEIAPVMSQSLDRSLTLRERIRLRLHLLVCVWCDLYLAQLRTMRVCVRACVAQSADDTPTAESALGLAARARLKNALRAPEL